MNSSTPYLSPSDAARQLGISVKTLRIYEGHDLLVPVRSEVGWRAYGPAEMSRAAEIVALRSLGFSLAQIARVLNGDLLGLEQALAAHQATLEGRQREIAGMVEKVRRLRDDLTSGEVTSARSLTCLLAPATAPVVAFDLPWPWGGEIFELRDIQPLTYITGPLFSGKTRLARRLAETLPTAAFLGLDRLSADGTSVRSRLDVDEALDARVSRSLTWLVKDGATPSDALMDLLAVLESDGSDILIIDTIEQGLDEASQQALVAHLRRRGRDSRPLFMLTRSTGILDLASVGDDEAIILCPANHNPPTFAAPYPSTPGYEAVATCLAAPAVRARTEGVIACRPAAA